MRREGPARAVFSARAAFLIPGVRYGGDNPRQRALRFEKVELQPVSPPPPALPFLSAAPAARPHTPLTLEPPNQEQERARTALLPLLPLPPPPSQRARGGEVTTHVSFWNPSNRDDLGERRPIALGSAGLAAEA